MLGYSKQDNSLRWKDNAIPDLQSCSLLLNCHSVNIMERLINITPNDQNLKLA